MAEYLCEFVEIAAVHHVPRRKSVTQIMKAEVFDLRSFQQIFEARLHPSSSAFGVCFRWKNEVTVDDKSNVALLHRLWHVEPQLFSQFWKHRNITHLPAFQLRSHRQQSLVVHHVRPSQAENL